MKKRDFFAALGLIMACTFTLAVGCDAPETEEPPHEHSWSRKWTADETHHWHKAICEHKTEVSDKETHDYGSWSVVTEPTCSEKGEKARSCEVCEYTQTKEIDFGEHTLVLVEGKTATCIENGVVEHYSCENCAKLFSDEEGTEEIDDATSVLLPKDSENHAQTTYEYLSNADGTTHNVLYSCCGEVAEEEVVCTPTADEPCECGRGQSGECVVHNLKIKEGGTVAISGHTVECINAGCDYEGTATHSFEEIVSEQFIKTEATCTAPAVYYKSCKCGFAAAGRLFEHGRALGHDIPTGSNASDYKKDTNNHWLQCSRCSENTAVAEHDFVGGSCNVCGMAANHTHTGTVDRYVQNADGTTHNILYSCCDTVVFANQACAATDDEDCTTQDACVCGRVFRTGNAAHTVTWISSGAITSTYHTVKCSVEGCEWTATEVHSYPSSTVICDVCNNDKLATQRTSGNTQIDEYVSGLALSARGQAALDVTVSSARAAITNATAQSQIDGAVQSVFDQVVTVSQSFSITFKINGATIATQGVLWGGDATDFPAIPEKAHYNGAWDKTTIQNVTASQTVNAVYSYIQGQLGGSFTRSDGSTVQSFAERFTLNDDGLSGTLKNPTYLFAHGVVGHTYYAECTFDNTAEDSWLGILVNALDGVPSSNNGWLGYGLYNNEGLYLHEKVATWADGTFKNLYVTTSKNFKIGVARIKNHYYVFVDGVLVLDEVVSHFKTSNHSQSLPADNDSGVGIFMGSNGGSVNAVSTVFYNFNCTTDYDEIIAKIGSAITYDSSKVTVKQNGATVPSGGILVAGKATEVTFNVPSGNVLSDLVFTCDGAPATWSNFASNKLTFTPGKGSSYAVTPTYSAKQTATLKLSVQSNGLSVGDSNYAFYEGLSVNPSDVTVRITNMATATAANYPLSTLTPSYSLESGHYLVEVTYKENTYSYNVYLSGGEVCNLVGEVSLAYLGGAVKIDGTTIQSYKNIAVGNTSGSNWALVNNQRDTVSMTSHTFALQNEKVGTKYYVEGTFNTLAYDDFNRSEFAGLLIAHGPTTLNDSGADTRLGAAIYGKSLLFSSTLKGEQWSCADTRAIANLDELGIAFDPTSVTLGVVRDGYNYYFFVDGKYVAYYYCADVTTASGFGVVSYKENLTVSKFNYSFNSSLINALKAQKPTANKTIDIYIIAGQSNGVGYSNYNANTLATHDERNKYGYQNILLAGDGQSTSNSATVHHYMDWQLVRAGQGNSVSKIGAEVGMAYELSKYYTGNRYAGIIKFAHGGTALLDNISDENACEGNWVSPSYAATLSGGGKSPGNLTGGLYRKLLQEFEKRMAELTLQGFTTVNVKGMFWMQGESDKGNPSEYATAFNYFVSDVRKDLGISDLKIYIGEISRTSGGSNDSTVNKNNAFIAGQNTLANSIYNCHIIKCGHLDIATSRTINSATVYHGTDAWHWNEHDMFTIGKLVGQSILKNSLGL